MVECACLENRCGASHRRFESATLRQGKTSNEMLVFFVHATWHFELAKRDYSKNSQSLIFKTLAILKSAEILKLLLFVKILFKVLVLILHKLQNSFFVKLFSLMNFSIWFVFITTFITSPITNRYNILYDYHLVKVKQIFTNWHIFILR